MGIEPSHLANPISFKALFHSIGRPVRLGPNVLPPKIKWKSVVGSVSDVGPFVSQRQNEYDVRLINQSNGLLWST